MKTLEEWVKELPEDFRKLIAVSGFRNVSEGALNMKVDKRVAMLYVQKFIYETLETNESIYYQWITLCIDRESMSCKAGPTEFTTTKLNREYHVSYWIDPYTSSGRTVYGQSMQDAISQICISVGICESRIIYVHAK
jgi:hypothetical protein